MFGIQIPTEFIFYNWCSFLPKITDVLVAINIEISDDVIFFGGRVDNVALVLSEVDQVDTVLFGVQGSLVHPSLAVVDDDLSKRTKMSFVSLLLTFSL